MALAGHPELIYYTMLVSGAYALVRLLAAWRIVRGARAADGVAAIRHAGAWPEARALAAGHGRAWALPWARSSFCRCWNCCRKTSAPAPSPYQQVVGWAWPLRHVLTFGLPDVFGNPSHHRWFDIWSG